MSKLVFLLTILALSGCAFANTIGTCTFNPATNTLIVTEGPESSADHGGVDCNLKDVASGLFIPSKAFFNLTEPTGDAGKFPCSDRVDITNNHVTMISDPRVPDQGLPCTENRTNVPEVTLPNNLGSGADLGDVLALCTGGKLTGGGKCSGTTTPVDLIVVSDVATVPEPQSLWLMGTGLLGVAGLVRRKLRL